MLGRVISPFRFCYQTFVLFSLIVRRSAFLRYLLWIGVDFLPILPLKGDRQSRKNVPSFKIVSSESNFTNQFPTARSVISPSPYKEHIFSADALGLLPIVLISKASHVDYALFDSPFQSLRRTIECNTHHTKQKAN